MMAYLTGAPWVQQLALILGAVLLGLFTERFLVRAFRSVAAKTESTWDDLIVNAIRGMPLLWWILAGVWSAILVRGVEAGIRERVVQGIVIVLIASLTLVATRVASGSVDRITERRSGSGLPSTTLVTNLVKLLIGTLGLFLILQNLGIEITPLITALGIGGLAVALALQDTLSNLFAGVSILLAGQIRPRDYIRLEDGPEGFVTDVKARNTTIRTFPNQNMVVIPNGVLASSIVTNYNLPQKSLWIAIPVGVSYDSDLSHVERVATEVGNETLKQVQARPSTESARVRYKAFGDSSIDLDVLLSVTAFTDQFLIRHEFIKALHTRFGAEGIEIPFPIRTLVMKNPERGEGGAAPG